MSAVSDRCVHLLSDTQGCLSPPCPFPPGPLDGSVTSAFTLYGGVTRSAYSDRLENGEYPLWVSRANSATNKAPATLFVWHLAPENHHQYGIFPDEQFETGRISEHGVPLPHTADRFRVFTVRAPPVGDPDGDHRAYHPAALSLSLPRTDPEEFRRRVRVGIWLANWYLPTLPVTKKIEQHFVDDTHWEWPRDTPSWQSFIGDGPRVSSGIFAGGHIRANPDNPEET